MVVAYQILVDHEIFRLRDEVEASEGTDVTFYDFLGVKPRASQDEITKAFRKQSRLIHPDKAKQSFIASKFKSTSKQNSGAKNKNTAARVDKGPSQREIRDAETQASDRFARLGVVANILKGPGRERYDHFLNNGFPKWKGTGYYYARLRPGLGSVLVGLFVLGGGAAHYAAMYLSWKRQREFVGRYIRHARRAAWGDEMGIKGIPGMDATASRPPPPPPMDGGGGAVVMNRRQKRFQEQQSKKDKDTKKAKGARSSGTDTPPEATTTTTSQGERKRVIAENGKVLIVDALGKVYLEEENNDGEKGEYLLDVDEIPRPMFRQTVLIRLPIWLFNKSMGRMLGSLHAADLAEDINEKDSGTEESDEGIKKVKTATNGTARRRGRRNGKAQ
ncbi:MAG: hypothetical protein M1830_003455 [Pleopsidium flavum]|nr:MAG: hypothetical protein M1830_003455 [Pleopsidium flavum]